MTIDQHIAEIGEDLVKCAEEDEEFSAQRGLMDELFPYIYRASKRMSTRAISRWLKDTRNIKLSAVTIAKGLREADEYWASYYDEVEPYAIIIGGAHKLTEKEVLDDEEWFEGIDSILPSTWHEDDEDAEYYTAMYKLRTEWYQMLDSVCREACLNSVRAAERQNEREMEVKTNEPEKK